MNLQITEEHAVCIHYFSAIINDDWSGLDSEDSHLLEDWLKSLPPHSTLGIEENSADFERDSVSGLMADCETLLVWERVI